MKVPWGAAVVIVACLTSVTVLAIARVDTTVIVAVIGAAVTPVLGALLYGKVEATYQNSNGNTTKLVELVSRQSDQLAQAMPPPVVRTPGESS